MINSKFTILSFYQFKQIKDLLTIKSRISNFCKFNKIKGTIIIAEEGINGTIAGTSQSIKNFQLEIKKIGFENFNPKYSYSKFMPFFRLKVRPKKEIVTLRTKMADPENITGNKIKPENWNNLSILCIARLTKFQGKGHACPPLDTQAAPPPLEHRDSGGLGFRPQALKLDRSQALGYYKI